MKKRKLFVSVVCILLAVLMALSVILMVIPVDAVTETDIKALQAKRLRLNEQLEQQAIFIEQLAENQALIIQRKAALDQQIAMNRSEIDLLSEQIRLYDEIIAGKALELSKAQEEEKEQSRILRVRIRSMEENSRYNYLDFLFDSGSITELLSRLADISDIMEYDHNLENALRQARTDVEAIKKDYELIQKEQGALCAELEVKKAQLTGQVEAACLLIANLDTLTSDSEAEYAAIAKAEEDAMRDILQAMAALEAQRASAYIPSVGTTAGSSGSSGYSGYQNTSVNVGEFIWPTDSTLITSGYGYRDQPTAGASSNHQAIDIGASAGSPIYAVADGQVVTATANNGLGNYVSIDHGGDVATRYSHMTDYIVQPGEYVTQGQIIGYVGSTGISTGAHLDFAVIENGQTVNPMDYYS